MVDVKTVPNVRRSIRFLDERVCLEVVEMPDRGSVHLTMSQPGWRDEEDDEITITLTADQWKVLQSLDYIDDDQPKPQPQPATHQREAVQLDDEDGAVH